MGAESDFVVSSFKRDGDDWLLRGHCRSEVVVGSVLLSAERRRVGRIVGMTRLEKPVCRVAGGEGCGLVVASREQNIPESLRVEVAEPAPISDDQVRTLVVDAATVGSAEEVVRALRAVYELWSQDWIESDLFGGGGTAASVHNDSIRLWHQSPLRDPATGTSRLREPMTDGASSENTPTVQRACSESALWMRT